MSDHVSRIDLTGRVAIVTGAGGGLGRQHALLLASRGAKVVVNDLGDAAQSVAAELVAAGGEARALQCSVTDADAVQAMVDAVLADWGRIDILVNNAGILRDKSFAKMALVGLMQTLALEGAKHGIKVNCLAPTAYTRMMEGILPQDQLDVLDPALVSPAVLALVADDAPTRAILCAGAGGYELAQITMTQGIHLGRAPTAEALLERWGELSDRTGEMVPGTGFDQARHELRKAGFAFDDAAG